MWSGREVKAIDFGKQESTRSERSRGRCLEEPKMKNRSTLGLSLRALFACRKLARDVTRTLKRERRTGTTPGP